MNKRPPRDSVFSRDSVIFMLLRNRIFLLLMLVIISLVSVFFLEPWAVSPEVQEHTITSLDEKKKDVQELTAAATAASVGITLLPGDAATPVADKMADLSTYMLIVLCAIYLEKYLVTVMGMVTFHYIIPFAMVIMGVSLFWRRRMCRLLSLRVLLFGLALYFVIPISVRITDIIETTYNSSVQSAVEAANELSREAKAQKEQEEEAKRLEEERKKEEEAQKGLLERIKDIPSAFSESASDVVASVTQVSEEKIKELEVMLNNFLESIAVMIITSCVIPILVLLVFFHMIKLVLNLGSVEHLAVLHSRRD